MGCLWIIVGAFVLFAVSIWKLYIKEYAMAIFNALWFVVVVACLEGVFENSQSYTWLLISTMIAFVNIGYIFGKYKIILYRKNINSIRIEKCNWAFLQKLLVLSLSILMVYFIMTVMRYGINLNLIRSSNNSGSEDTLFNSLLDTLIFYGFSVPMIYTGALVIMYNISQKNKIPRNIIGLICANIIAYVFTTGGRSLVIRIALFLCAAIIWRIHSSGKKNIKIHYILIGGLLLYLMLNIMTILRNTENISFFEQFFQYAKGAILHMDYNIKNVKTEKLYYGYVTYGGFFYYPVKLLQKLLGIHIDTSNEIMFFLQTYKRLSIGENHTMYYNALLPNAYYYYYDMGYAGVIIFSMILGYVARRGEKSYNKPQFLSFAIWATSIYAIVYSCFGGVLWSFSIPTALIYCVILNKSFFKTKEVE